MTRPRRGGLGRGLGALIPTQPPESSASTPKASEPVLDRINRPADADVMSGQGAGVKGPGAGKRVSARGAASGTTTKVANRVPSVAAIAASSATDFYFDPSPVPGAMLRELRPDEIRTNPKQPRLVFDDAALEELTHSIKEFGVLQPIVVREVADGFELVMGERRLRASVAAGLDRIPAIVRDTEDSAMLRDALLENIHRAQLNPLEEAAAYQQLLEEFGVTHDELASKIGRSRSQVSNTIRLLNLSIPVQRRVAAGVISAGHARALLGLPGRDDQDDLAARIVAEGLSVRATEELVSLTVGRPPSKRSAVKRAANVVSEEATSAVLNRLAATLDTSVRIESGQRKGKITIEFGSLVDLERIADLISGPLPGS